MDFHSSKDFGDGEVLETLTKVSQITKYTLERNSAIKFKGLTEYSACLRLKFGLLSLLPDLSKRLFYRHFTKMWLLKSASRTSAAIRSALKSYDSKERVSFAFFESRTSQ